MAVVVVVELLEATSGLPNVMSTLCLNFERPSLLLLLRLLDILIIGIIFCIGLSGRIGRNRTAAIKVGRISTSGSSIVIVGVVGDGGRIVVSGHGPFVDRVVDEIVGGEVVGGGVVGGGVVGGGVVRDGVFRDEVVGGEVFGGGVVGVVEDRVVGGRVFRDRRT